MFTSMEGSVVVVTGGIDVLCPNAGVFPERPFVEMTDAEVDADRDGGDLRPGVRGGDPAHRLGGVEDIGYAVLFLAIDGAVGVAPRGRR